MKHTKHALALALSASLGLLSFVPSLAHAKPYLEVQIEAETTASQSPALSAQERASLLEFIYSFFYAIDQKHFDQVKAMLSPEVRSTAVFNGQSAITRGRDGIVDPWIQNLSPITAIHHQVSNFRIKALGSGRYEVNFYGLANWYRANAAEPVTWFVGDYTWQLQRHENQWSISEMIYRNKFVHPPL